MTGKPSPFPRIRPGLRRPLAAMLDRAPQLLLVVALMSAAFVGGMYVYKEKVFPYSLFRAAWLTGRELFEIHVSESPLLHGAASVDVTPGRREPLRFEFIGADALADPILVAGGAAALSGYCPGATSCLAIEYAGRGEVVHAWPYRPDEIANAPAIADLPYEEPLGFRFSRHAYPVGVSRYANGDLLVIFQLIHTFPYAGGVARIDRDGRVVWYRRDYSHHYPHLIDGDVALVPGMRIGEGPIRARYPTGKRRPGWTLHCDRPFLDFVHVVDGEGRLLEEISVFDALVESPYGRLLLYRNHPCDPTHLNFVHQVREDAGGVSGIEAGDLVVSLRNLNAFGILDRDDRRLKRLVRGTFFRQHSVTHLEGTKFLMFDNYGGDGVHGPSRLLLVDVAEGTEHTVFPNGTTPGHLQGLFSFGGGHISVSPDRRRVFVTFSREGKAVEVRLADGAVLTVLTKPYHPVPSGERKRPEDGSIFIGYGACNTSTAMERGSDDRNDHGIRRSRRPCATPRTGRRGGRRRRRRIRDGGPGTSRA